MSHPAFDELPRDPAAGPRAWPGAPDDDVGLLRLQTPARVVEAAAVIRTGEVFSLNAPLDVLNPALFRRGGYSHTVIQTPNGFDDRIDGFFPQSSSQWDALAHVAFAPGVFYGGASAAEVRDGHRNTIEAWARRGIAGRAVLLDLTRAQDYRALSSQVFTVAHLEQAERDAGTSIRPGDVVLLHTGWLAEYGGLEPAERARLAQDRLSVRAAGLEHSEEMARYLWTKQIAAVASDGPTVEVWPPDESASAGPFGFLHRVLIGGFGMALGELWWLADLAASCARDGRHEVFLTSAPLFIPGGIGAPANALAIK